MIMPVTLVDEMGCGLWAMGNEDERSRRARLAAVELPRADYLRRFYFSPDSLLLDPSDRRFQNSRLAPAGNRKIDENDSKKRK